MNGKQPNMKNNLNIFVRFWGICRSKHWCYERCIPWAYYKDFLLIKQSCFINYFNNSKISIKMSNNSSFMSNDKYRTIVNSGLTWILVINKMWFWKEKNQGWQENISWSKDFHGSWFINKHDRETWKVGGKA